MIDHQKVMSTWNRLHFLLYLYIDISKEDAMLKEEEIRVIYDKLTPISIHYTASQTQAILKEVLEEHSHHSEEETQTFIRQYCSNLFKSERAIEKLMADLDDIIDADGYVNSKELTIYRTIKRILSDALIAERIKVAPRQAS